MNQYREQETGHTAGAMPGMGLFFVVNPASHSGKGMKLWKQVKGLLSDQGISHEVRFSKKQGDIARIVTEPVKQGFGGGGQLFGHLDVHREIEIVD